jgi:hypothetical protein
MDETRSNGAADEVVDGTALERRAAGLSAEVVRRPQPAGLAVTPEVSARELVARLDVIREAMRTAMQEGVDYGRVPGTDKPGLFKPGAEKLCVLFQLDIQPSNELRWGPGEHLTVISRATVYHAPSGTRLGYGEGICSTRERKYAHRRADRACPECGQSAVLKSKDERGGWFCWRKKGGCGAQFPDGDERIERQPQGEIENPDLADTWNTIDKMAKKRAYVDAALSVTGASAIFTQDVGADPSETSTEAGPAHGPLIPAEIKARATNAAIRLCGGDVDQARAMWERIQAELHGYMPHAAAIALLAAAEALPDHTAGNGQAAGAAQTNAPHAARAAGDTDTRAQKPASAAREVAALEDDALRLWSQLVPEPQALRKVSDAQGDPGVLQILIDAARRNLQSQPGAA